MGCRNTIYCTIWHVYTSGEVGQGTGGVGKGPEHTVEHWNGLFHDTLLRGIHDWGYMILDQDDGYMRSWAT